MRVVPAGPSWRTLLPIALGALGLHLLLLLGVPAPLKLRLSSAPQASTVQVRMVQLPPPQTRRPPAVVAKPQAEPGARTLPVPLPETPVAQTSATETPSAEMPLPVQTAVSESGPQNPQDAPPAEASEAGPSGSAWPPIALGALPPSQLLTYQLSGMDKGLNYHASGELRWQHNPSAYTLTLSVRAFLVGRREWRSMGQIDASGLSPVRFSDSWRQERAAHFDREQQRVVFSSNSTPAPLQSGAQDQVSLYVQLAAAMSAGPERFVPGTQLQVQTATVRDALPWALVLTGTESLELGGQTLQVSKWVCQPRNRFEARVELWVAAAQSWMPVRIRITQASGSYIDLLWRSTEPLPPLPKTGDASPMSTGS